MIPKKAQSSKLKARSCRILGIETSCDETAVALVKFNKYPVSSIQYRVSGRFPYSILNTQYSIRVLKNFVSSQIPIHQKYGGVVPEVAARSHVPEIVALLTRVLKARSYKLAAKSFDCIAVTRGPGLATALRIGIEAARVLAFVSKKPVIGVNHLEGHLASAWLNATNRKKWKFPLLALIVSGGHTELVLMKNFCHYKIVGQTRDDAAGEAFDKSAKLMGLPYPGGPHIAKLAEKGDPTAFNLPRPMIKDPSLDFSFSGLKTAVRNEWELSKLTAHSSQLTAAFAASLQQTIIDVLIEKTMRAAKKFNVNGVLLVGGVSANLELRRQMKERIKKELPRVAFLPSDRKYVTDNAAMIAAAGFWRLMKGQTTDWKKMDAEPELELS